MRQLEFHTKRLLLRMFRPEDAARTAALAGTRAVTEMTMRIPFPYTESMAAEWIARHEELRRKNRALLYAITLLGEDDLIGSIGLKLDLENRRGEMGYWLGRRYWGNGYASEAAESMLDYAFTVLDLHKVTAHRLARNEASGRILEKVGMRREGLLRDHVRKGERYEDVVQYAILKEERGGGGRLG